MSTAKPFLEVLQTLQCHFTWDMKFGNLVEDEHNQLFLNYKCKHTPYGNGSLYLGIKAFLYCRQSHYADALGSLLAAEEMVKQDHPSNFSLHNLVTYGNYAWIYYYLANLRKVQFYLAEIHKVCQSLNSPQPYSVINPEIMAQKGWSLLVMGLRGGEEAMKCFQMALRGDPSNAEFKGGLAISQYILWERFQTTDHRDKAKELLEEMFLMQPENYEAKVYLANLLLRLHQDRAIWLLEDVVRNSLSADILRQAAVVCVQARPPRWHQAISILKKAISLDPNYYLLYYELGLYYKHHMTGQVPSEERAALMEAATVNLHYATETDFLFVFPILELATIYGETSLAYEEEIYLNLIEKLPMVNTQSQQAIHIFWGDFLLHKKGQKHQALDSFMTGLRIPGGRFKEKNELKKRLMMLAKMFQEDSNMDQSIAIHNFLQTMEGQHDNGHTGDLC